MARNGRCRRGKTVEETPMTETMAPPTPQIEDPLDPELCWALLGRVASSAQLKRATRLKELLFYIGHRSLKEGCDQVHEQEIGFKVFGRSDSYDTSVDNIVRTNVSDLRKRIEAYFNSEGLHESVVMDIPRGSSFPSSAIVRRGRNSTRNRPPPSPSRLARFRSFHGSQSGGAGCGRNHRRSADRPAARRRLPDPLDPESRRQSFALRMAVQTRRRGILV